jgi:hypothetical protein
MIYTNQNSIIIDNVVVSYSSNILRLTSISYLLKKNININHLHKKTFGNRKLDNDILNKLSVGDLKFEDVF